MNQRHALIAAALATVCAAGATPAQAQHANPQKEKCYGISKAGQNDCATATHSCAGQAATDNDKQEWRYVERGACEDKHGGSTRPGGDLPPAAR